MNRLSEQMLMEAYKKSVQLNLDTRFIQLLYHEIERRKSSNKKVLHSKIQMADLECNQM